MMTLPLTEKQEALWRFIRSCDRSPTYDEMSAALGHTYKGRRVVELVNALERRGYVRRTPGRARSIVAVDPRADLSTFPTEDLQAELERRLAA